MRSFLCYICEDQVFKPAPLDQLGSTGSWSWNNLGRSIEFQRIWLDILQMEQAEARTSHATPDGRLSVPPSVL